MAELKRLCKPSGIKQLGVFIVHDIFTCSVTGTTQKLLLMDDCLQEWH